MIVDPITIAPDKKISDALALMERYRISGVPVTRDGKLVGILTNRDLRFESRFDLPISDVMTKDNLITVPVGTTLEQAEEILHRHRVEKLLVVDDQYYPQRPDHRQGHPEETQIPQLRQGRAGPSARRRGHRRHRRFPRTRPGTGAPQSRRDRHRHRARPQPARDRSRQSGEEVAARMCSSSRAISALMKPPAS